LEVPVPVPVVEAAVLGLNTGASTLKVFKSADDDATVCVIKRGKATPCPINYADEFVVSAYPKTKVGALRFNVLYYYFLPPRFPSLFFFY
jgi:hypothetical protein